MKVDRASDFTVVLRPESDEDRSLLDDFAKYGITISHRGSTTGIISLNAWAAGAQRAFYIDRDEQAILAYALGRIGFIDDLRYRTLVSKIIPAERQEEG